MKQIDNYKILDEISTGSMGIIYKALDERIDRTVAIKTMRRELVGDEVMHGRFMVEAKAAAKLNHPNIITIYKFGKYKETYYIVMEYLEGKDLKEFIQDYPNLSTIKKLEIIEQAAQGLFFAHENGVVHRDIKPANLMILESGLVKITDFGIAHLDATHLTKTGVVVGTPDYMSPEQVLGETVDNRSDIFSLGVVLYQLVSGRKPFDAPTVNSVLYKIANENPPTFDALDMEVPFEIESIITRALEKDPQKRYHDLGKMLADLQSAIKILGEDQPETLQKITSEAKYMMDEAERLLKEKRPKEALFALEFAEQIDSENSSIFRLVEKAESALQDENQERIGDILTRAQKASDSDKPEEALHIALQAFNIASKDDVVSRFMDKQILKIKTKTGDPTKELRKKLIDLELQRRKELQPKRKIIKTQTSEISFYSTTTHTRLKNMPREIRALIEDGDRLYFHRRGLIDDVFSINKLMRAVALDPDSYEAAWRLSRNYYDKGILVTSNAEQKRAFNQGITWGKRATEIEDGRAEGHYWLAVSLAKWADVNGIFRGIVLIDRIKKELNRVIELDDKYAEGGAYRILGRMKFRMPVVLGGSIEESLRYYRQAYDIDPRQPDTLIFMAESLISQKKYNEAKKHLTFLMELVPLPHAAFETEHWRKHGEKMLLKLEAKHL